MLQRDKLQCPAHKRTRYKRVIITVTTDTSPISHFRSPLRSTTAVLAQTRNAPLFQGSLWRQGRSVETSHLYATASQ